MLLRLRNFPPADPSPLPPHRDLSTLRLRRPELTMLAVDPILLSAELAVARPQVYHSTQLSLPALRRYRAVITIHRSEEHTSELQSRLHLVCRLLLEKKKKKNMT